MSGEEPNEQQNPPHQGSDDPPFLTRVCVTGGSGFVGRAVVRELVARGHKPVCLARDRQRFASDMSVIPDDRYQIVAGDLFDDAALAEVVTGAEAATHLVGIITEDRLRRQTFERIHVEGTRRIVDACKEAGVRRYVHMSALGARRNAVSQYHQTKWTAENYVGSSGLDWTVFRPSIIHGPDGEFMRMMRLFMCSAALPVIPYFGDGQNRVQPVSVKDVARCFVAALSKPETIGQVYELGGPDALSWKALYRTCRELIPGSKSWKPFIGQPVAAAKLMARTVMRLPILPRMLRFDEGQVQMSQEDSVCDIGPVEKTFGIKLRSFREELAAYAAQIE